MKCQASLEASQQHVFECSASHMGTINTENMCKGTGWERAWLAALLPALEPDFCITIN